jgi:hypothetical protein
MLRTAKFFRLNHLMAHGFFSHPRATTDAYKSFYCNNLDGGEGGIRTRHDPLESVTYRFHNARVAVNASDAVAPCTLLHARPRSTIG